jgi:hypothetical protein
MLLFCTRKTFWRLWQIRESPLESQFSKVGSGFATNHAGNTLHLNVQALRIYREMSTHLGRIILHASSLH